MARTLGPVCKRCRREGKKLYLEGVRAATLRLAFEKAGRENRFLRECMV